MSINLINEARSFEINSSIVEWDIRRAGLNLIKERQLLNDSQIKHLEELSKLDADISIGKLQIKDKEFSKNLEKAFTDIMNEFLIVNRIDKEFDVTSIKKDACFTINKTVKQATFGKYIEFIPKNEYHAYIYLKPFEFYFKRNGDVTIKGLTSDKTMRNEILKAHEDGILNFIRCVIDIAETTNMNQKRLNEFLHSFVEMYKKKELEFDYYREFNVTNKFRYQLLGGEMMTDNIDENMLKSINIEHNYTKIVLPLINLIC